MKHTCPFGHKCEVRDDSNNVEERCRLYVVVHGENPQTKERIDKWDCAMALMPLMQIETSNEVRGVHAATNSFRNEVAKPHILPDADMLRLMKNARNSD